MSYIAVLPIAEVKTYLRIDDGNDVDDDLIQQLIETALNYIEEYTRYFVFESDKTYPVQNGCINIYDAPINSVESPTDAERVDFALYSQFNLNATSLQLKVGATAPALVEAWVKVCAKQIIDVNYYGAKDGSIKEFTVPPMTQKTLDLKKRFVI